MCTVVKIRSDAICSTFPGFHYKYRYTVNNIDTSVNSEDWKSHLPLLSSEVYFLSLCPVLIFGLNHSYSEKVKVFLEFFVFSLGLSRYIKVCLFWWWSSLLGRWSRSSHVFSLDAGSLLSRNPESFSGARRAGRPVQAGLGRASPSSVQPPVKTSTQRQSWGPALAALNPPPSLCRVKDGTQMWKFPEKSPHGGLPPSHE